MGREKVASVLLVVLIVITSGCIFGDGDVDHRQEMRDLVQRIARTARKVDPDFIIVAQNGHELATDDGRASGKEMAGYLGTLDGVGREELFYGYTGDDVATPVSDRNAMLPFMDIFQSKDVTVMVTDYCTKQGFIWDAYQSCAARGYLGFAANSRQLDTIPPYPSEPFDANSRDVVSLTEANNFLYLINPGPYTNRTEYLAMLRETNYDVLIIDAFFGNTSLTVDEVRTLGKKQNGGDRLVLAYISVGEAEDYRYYWKYGWRYNPPDWIEEENPDWPGNYKVQYWQDPWKDILYRDPDSYLSKTLNSGFDGVYLDLIDAYEYFE
jgi:cysteinyl-tRNA synthetase